MSDSAARQVAKAAGLIAAISVGGKLIAFAREQVIANYYGATQLTDAYFTASAVPQMIVAVLGGAVCTALLPMFLRYSPENRQDGWQLVSVVFRWLTIVLVVATVACYLTTPALVRLLAPNFEPEQQYLTISLLRVMLYGVVFMGIVNLFSTMLNAHRQFIWPAIRPLVLNLATIIGTIVLSSSLGISGLAWAKLVGIVAEAAVMVWQVRINSFPIWASHGYWHPDLRKLVYLAMPIFLSSIFTDAYVFIDKVLASGLDYGSIAALHYASGLMHLPVGIFVAAVSTAIYPTLAEHARRQDNAGSASSVGSGLRLLTLIMLPAAVGMFVLRMPIVNLVYHRGSFDSAAVSKTASALAFYLPGVLGLANQQILSRAFYAHQDSMTPLKVRIGASLLHILLSVLLVGPLRHAGLALASSVSVLCNMGLLMVLLRSKLKLPLEYGRSLASISVASLAMGIAVHFIYIALYPAGQLVALGMATTIGAVIYFLCVSKMGVEEVRHLILLVRGVLIRKGILKEGCSR